MNSRTDYCDDCNSNCDGCQYDELARDCECLCGECAYSKLVDSATGIVVCTNTKEYETTRFAPKKKEAKADNGKLQI